MTVFKEIYFRYLSVRREFKNNSYIAKSGEFRRDAEILKHSPFSGPILSEKFVFSLRLRGEEVDNKDNMVPLPEQLGVIQDSLLSPQWLYVGFLRKNLVL